ncbi:MAG TPA: GTP cyclohydrolase I FolE [Chitinophagales bacterium]|nr:GTP cyclohydrolase I FolE [Chitinophagales bacterium]
MGHYKEEEDLDFEINYRQENLFSAKKTKILGEHFRKIMETLGEDVARDGLQKSPQRVARAMQYLTQGYNSDPYEIMRSAMFDEAHSQMVIVKDIELYSFCEHHLLPFYGRAHVAYIPNGKIVGLSKIARVVDIYARRFQLQERLTCQVRDCINETLKPLGVAVVIEAKHLCMMMRGVQKQNSVTTTSAFVGEFEKQPTRDEFIELISAKLS